MDVGVGPGITVGQLEEQLGNLRKIGMRDSVLEFRSSGPVNSLRGTITLVLSREVPEEPVVDDE